ncbi:MAG TPA: imidazole glycerol phosphate synthase subunit HisF [Armatimonadota bacterium]|jgi:cyclase
MLAKRIICALDIREGRVVKGTKFLNLRDAGDPIELASLYDSEGADEIVFLDITASHEKRDILLDVARRTAEAIFIPFCVGGGVRTVEEFRNILATGADKCFINTSAIQTPELISQAADRFGSQCVVVAIDAKATSAEEQAAGKPRWEVYIHGGRTPTGLDAVEWAHKVEQLGAGEILLTSMDTDGVQEGYDLPMTRAVADAVKVPVIASGGAGNALHLYEGLTEGGAEAALIASIVHYGKTSIRELKDYLHQRGVVVRRK